MPAGSAFAAPGLPAKALPQGMLVNSSSGQCLAGWGNFVGTTACDPDSDYQQWTFK
ncbi:RICIN domain-containing protein (plasmid) [Streptomyces sp. NBC_00464]|uniref:hypothetical protein n=1 Tax=Streptomyces sp. NBC_00464 TaxID=2975751 RepID=UPI002E190EC3